MGKYKMNLQTLIQYQLSEGLTEHDLAAAIGVPTFTIHRVLKGREPKNPEILRKLAGYFRIDVNRLGREKLGLPPTQRKDLDIGEHAAHRYYRKVPLLSWAEAIQVGTHPDSPSFLASRQKMIETELSGAQIFALHVKDNSMEPLFHKGELFFVNPELEPQAGDYVVAWSQREEADPGCLRQLNRFQKGYALHPLNNNYQDTSLTSHQKIIGRVIRLRKDL